MFLVRFSLCRAFSYVELFICFQEHRKGIVEVIFGIRLYQYDCQADCIARFMVIPNLQAACHPLKKEKTKDK